MINKIKYKFRKFKLKWHLIIRNEYGDSNILNKKYKEKRKFYIKRVLCNPIKLFFKLVKKELNINYIEIVLTTICTLKCRGCSALMDKYKEQSHTDIDINIKSLKRLINCCDTIGHFRILGGEPLCYPNLYEILELVKDENKVKRVTIVTNGTLLINDKKIINILKNSKYDVFISNYGKTSRKKDELIKELKDNNIKYQLGNEEFKWRDYGNLECRNRNKKDLAKQFYQCNMICNSLFKGKIHHCPRSTHGTNLKKIPLRQEDYIDILDKKITDKELRKKLYKFFYGYVPYVEACNYCNNGTKEIKNIPAGEQVKR